MRTFALVALAAFLVAGAVYAAGATITVSSPYQLADAGVPVGSACTPPSGTAGALGNYKNWLLQCSNAKVYARRAGCSGCLNDAGYGDPIYDFTAISNDHLPQPAKIRLRTNETRICLRNTAQPVDGGTADAGDAFTCWLNEDEPY